MPVAAQVAAQVAELALPPRHSLGGMAAPLRTLGSRSLLVALSEAAMVSRGRASPRKPPHREAEEVEVAHQSLAQVEPAAMAASMDLAGAEAAVVSTVPTPAQVEPEHPASSSLSASR